MLDERQISDLMLTEIESAERPSVVLDVERAMSTARRQRRLAQGAGAALLAVALTVGGLTVPDLLTPDRPPAPAPFGTAHAGGETGLPVALTTIDPQRVYVRFGWLPDGLRNLQYQAGTAPRPARVVYLGASNGRTGDQRQSCTRLTLSPRGCNRRPPAGQRGVRPGRRNRGRSRAERRGQRLHQLLGRREPEAILALAVRPEGLGAGPGVRGGTGCTGRRGAGGPVATVRHEPRPDAGDGGRLTGRPAG